MSIESESAATYHRYADNQTKDHPLADPQTFGTSLLCSLRTFVIAKGIAVWRVRLQFVLYTLPRLRLCAAGCNKYDDPARMDLVIAKLLIKKAEIGLGVVVTSCYRIDDGLVQFRHDHGRILETSGE